MTSEKFVHFFAAPDRMLTAAHLAPLDRMPLQWTDEQASQLRLAMEQARLSRAEIASVDELGIKLICLHVDDEMAPHGRPCTLQVSAGGQILGLVGIKTWATKGDWRIQSMHCGPGDQEVCREADASLWAEEQRLVHGALVSSFYPMVVMFEKIRSDAPPLDMILICRRVDNLVDDLVHPEERCGVHVSIRSYTGEIPVGDPLDVRTLVQIPIAARPLCVGSFAIEIVPNDDAVYEAVGMQSFNAPEQVAIRGIWNSVDRRQLIDPNESIDLGGWPTGPQGRHFNMGKFSRNHPLLMAFRPLAATTNVACMPPANLTLLCRKISDKTGIL